MSVACASQSDYENLKAENEQLLIQLEKLKIENLELKQSIEELQEKKDLESMYSEEDALKFIKDYYEFYKADLIYRKPRVRKVNSNTFIISLEENTKKGNFKNNDFFWTSKVLTLVINNDGTYKVKSKY